MARRVEQKAEAKRAAQERAAAIRAEREAAERRRRLFVAGVTLGVVALVVVGLIVAAMTKGDPKPVASGAPLGAESQKTLTGVPATTFDAVGYGSVDNGPQRVKNGTLVAPKGKPQILYVGAEYCPFCAGLRWSTAVAMSRFGTWTPLQTTHSAPAPEAYPDTATLSFAQKAGTRLTSEYLDFVPYETATNTMRNGRYGTLDDLGGADLDLFKKLNAPPYVTKGAGSIPFISFGGKAIQAGGIYDTSLLQGKTADQIVAALKNPEDPVAKAVLGGANAITAATCEVTGGKPETVCSSAGVKAAAARLGSAG